jgi:hypothetical protein
MNSHATSLFRFRALLIAALSPLVMSSSIGRCEQLSAPYPSTGEIEASPLDATRREQLLSIFNSALTPTQMVKTTKELCPAQLGSSVPQDSAFQRAITETKISLATELLFERTAELSGAAPDKFSFLSEFSPTRLLIQHSEPRFPSDGPGLSIPLQNDIIRAVRSEGRLGADIFILIPPARECRIQSLVVCPRRYEKIDRLVPSPYKLAAARVLVNAKAEGILAVPSGTTAKVMASIQVSGNIPHPDPWFESREGARTISAVKVFMQERVKPDLRPPFISPLVLPFSAAIESRVDIGTASHAVRSSSKRVTVEISSIELTDKPNLIVGKSELSVVGGACYLVSQWVDEVV